MLWGKERRGGEPVELCSEEQDRDTGAMSRQLPLHQGLTDTLTSSVERMSHAVAEGMAESHSTGSPSGSMFAPHQGQNFCLRQEEMICQQHL